MKAKWLAFLLLFFNQDILAQYPGGGNDDGGGGRGGSGGARTRGVDFRMQLNSGTLDFTGISGVQRVFSGFGSELSAHFYLIEKTRFRANLFLSTRVMSYTGTEVLEGETDDLQVFTVAPGLELSYGILHLQVGYQSMNVNSYFISSFSQGRAYSLMGPMAGAHLNFRMGNLGLGLGATQSTIAVDPTKLGLAADQQSQWKELTYSLNVIYFIGSRPKKFFRQLFK